MHISSIMIKNFRRFNQNPFCMDFNPGLNILIGENNVGKTTVLEAIALCLSIGDFDKPFALQPSDFHDQDLPIEVKLVFSDLNNSQEAAFHTALSSLNSGAPTVEFTFHFEIKGSRIIRSITCGQTDALKSSEEMLTYIHCNYLKAVRDVTLEFSPGFRNRIAKILERKFSVLSKARKEEFIEIFNEANTKAKSFSVPLSELGHTENHEDQVDNESASEYRPIEILESAANDIIHKLQFIGDDNDIYLCFIEHELRRILRNVIAKLQTLDLDLTLNGMGYNNLIYLAMLLTELEQGYEDHEYLCLIVEEPEAHLHPQLQKLLLEYFSQEFPNVQVFLSSHSPIFVSDSLLDNIIVMITADSGLINSVPLKSIGLSMETKSFLRRFLDVTRAQLFFARNIVFVEGYSEAMLFKAFWNEEYRDDEKAFHKQSIEVVNIQGIAFDYYVELIEKVYVTTGTKCVVITDDDRGTGNDVPDELKITQKTSLSDAVSRFDIAPLSARYQLLKKSIEALKEKGISIELCTARKTLEVEFGYANSENPELLAKVVGGSIDYWADSNKNINEVAIDIWLKVAKKKTSFALEILDEMGTDRKLVSPIHFKKAFDFIGGSVGTREPVR